MPEIKLYFGDEDFLIDEELKTLKKGLSSQFNFERIDGSRTSINEIISAISSMPMLGGQRMVIIEGLEYEEEDEKKLFSALQDLAPGISVVFVYYGSVDKRRRFYKLMEKIADVKEYKSYTEWEQDKALAWLVNRIKLYKKKISGRAANLLLDIVGTNLRMIDKELEKISTYIGERDTIEEKDVSDLASSGEVDSFAFSNAIRDKNLTNAVMSLRRLFKNNEQPHVLIGMMAKLYRMLLQVKCLEKEGFSQFEIASRLKAKPFFVKKCMEKTNLFSIEELSNNIKKLHFTDIKLKTGASPKLTLELLVPELCQNA